MIKNQRVVITGASSGIGSELCKLLAEHNKIVAVARRAERIPQHRNIIPLSIDVSTKEGMDRLLDTAYTALGNIDIFISNAGFAYYERWQDASWEHMDAIFKTNVYAPLYGLQALRQRKGKEPFQYLITASAMSFYAMPGYALYSGTKFALRGFADSMRYELEPGQHLQLIYPIATLTEFFLVAQSDHLPWPRQKASAVAKAIAKGIEQRKPHIYPSLLYRIMQIVSRIIPIIPIYMGIEGWRFRKEFSQGGTHHV
ncbi:SDR family oxidoreductase [Gracilinema caldarium]|uniref:SDR family NAD(P)-dependent oxidoreductase n=1 Tax=Gracilinema caldarium TaxID=215591 RepID=UPI0026EE9843|nr:SDR family NAD(P)-dependent oxidoreductase [Gracilinema caldarium]